MAALSWDRPALATTTSKAPKVSAALTQSAPGDNSVIIDFYVEESADADYTTDTIMARFSGVLSVSGNKLEITLTPRYWDGNDTYTSATNPSSSTAPVTGTTQKLLVCADLDAFYATGGFARVNPA